MEERIKQIEERVKSLEDSRVYIVRMLMKLDEITDSQNSILTNLYDATKSLAERTGIKV